MGAIKEYIYRCEQRGLNPEQWHNVIIAEIQAERNQAEQHKRIRERMQMFNEFEQGQQREELQQQETEEELEQWKRQWYENEDPNDYIEVTEKPGDDDTSD